MIRGNNLTEATQAAGMGFDHINLNTVDPQGVKVPLGEPINFQVTEAVKKTYANENGSGEYVQFRFTVTDSPDFSGRSFYKSVFEDKEGGKNPSARQLRILMDASGIQQDGTFDEWLSELVAQKATFSAPLEETTNKKTGRKSTSVNMWKIEPAQ